MDDSSPPPVPDRPGRATQIHSIDNIRTESTPNEYVDTATITGAQHAPQRPPKLHKNDRPANPKSKAHPIKDIEQHENIRNELREQLQVCSKESKPVITVHKSPEIPPRSDRPPPIPPRDSRLLSSGRVPGRPVATRSTPDKSWKCNSHSSRLENNRMTNNKATLPATVLIITEESRFPTSRSLRRDKAAKETSASSQPVTQQPAANSVTLTLGDSGYISNTIICRQCKQCRCSSCSGDRKLPEQWLCEGNCLCSGDSVVDTLSCMCCVKGCFKTVIDNRDSARVHPCAGTKSPNCLLRWTALAALSLCLPCLCCYGPMRLGVKAATACYNCRKRGCNCDE